MICSKRRRSFFGYSSSGSPLIFPSWPAFATAASKPPSSSTSFHSLAWRPLNTRPSACGFTSSTVSLRPFATASMNCWCTSASIPSKYCCSSAVIWRNGLPESLSLPALIVRISTFAHLSSPST